MTRLGRLASRIQGVLGGRSRAAPPPRPTLLEGSLADERHPEVHPQRPGELAHKAKIEASEGGGVVDKAKRVAEEIDRDIAGEYERREDPTAPPARR